MNDILKPRTYKLKPRTYKWNHYPLLPGYKTPLQIAEMAGCSKQWVFDTLLRHPDIKGFRVGNHVVVLTDKEAKRLVAMIKG